MHRPAEILDILKGGLDGLVKDQAGRPLKCTRYFDYTDNKATLRVESLNEQDGTVTPLGKIDVEEVPTNNGRVTCRCLMTDLKAGESKRVFLRISGAGERDKECGKIYDFFTHLIEPADVASTSNGTRGRHK
tara:strand:+ start:413 stop:808 length:396 start_codon:yes stop_codon:yes gene_type:complete